MEAWRELSTALQTDGQTDEAIAAQKQVVVLAPKDADALRELAGLYLAQSTAKQQEAQIVQIQTAYQGAGQGFPGLLITSAGQSLLDDKISSAVNAQDSATDPDARRRGADRVGQAVDAYKKIAALQPDDPNIQLELAQAAQQAGDTATAIAAYTTFLKLAPDDPSASIVKAQLKQLKQTSASSG